MSEEQERVRRLLLGYIARVDKVIYDMYHQGIGNDDSRMIYAWREFDALNKEEK